jgi:hypothetical protein
MTASEGRRLFERQARRSLNMSGEEFIAKWRAGKFNGTSDTPRVMRVAMLLPFAER